MLQMHNCLGPVDGNLYHPFTPGSFSSYYYYLPESPSHELVRIRLELGRNPSGYDDGGTWAFLNPHTCVGFSPYTFIPDDQKKFRVTRDGRISVPFKSAYRPSGIHVGGPSRAYLYKEPIPGYRVYDFLTFDSSETLDTPHMGNTVIGASDTHLPPGITGHDLETLADICLKRDHDINLTDRHAQPDELANAIKKLIRLERGCSIL